MTENRQISVSLPAATFDRLRRLSISTNKTYAALVTAALDEFPASSSLVSTSAVIVYAQLPPGERLLWKRKIRDLRASGQSFGGIAKRLFSDHQLAGADKLPLSPSTVRGICAE